MFDAVCVVGAARTGCVAWRDALAAVQASCLFRVSQSRNSVYLPVAGTLAEARLVFKLSPDADNEANLLSAIRRYAPDVYVPDVVHAEPELLVTEFVEGETLHDQLRWGDFDALPAAIRATAHLHERLPRLWEPTDLALRLEKRLACPHLGISADLIAEIMGTMAPLLELLNAQTSCAYLDRVPVNFLVTSTGIVAIDFEGAEWAPPALDVANLLSYMDYTTHLWRDGMDLYLAATHMRASNRRDFWGSFCAAVVYRCLCFCSAWSRPRQAHLRAERTKALARALLAIDLLKPVVILSQLKAVQGGLCRLKVSITAPDLAEAA